MSQKGIIVFDIDGTLTHRLDQIDPRVVKMLEHLVLSNWQVALFTGRIFSFAYPLVQHFSFPYLLAVQNGADILEMPQKKRVRRCYLDEQVLPMIEEACQGEEEDFIIHAGIDQGDFCYYRKERFSPKMLEYLQIRESLSNAPWRNGPFVFKQGTTFPLINTFGKKQAMERIQKKIQMLDGVEISMIQDPVDPLYYLNLITHPQANKGEALLFVKQAYQVSFTIAAGDDQNDLKMLQAADLAIAVDGAPPALLKIADVIAKKPEQLGIIDAVEEAMARARR